MPVRLIAGCFIPMRLAIQLPPIFSLSMLLDSPYLAFEPSLVALFLAISRVFLPPAISHCTSQVAAMAQRIKPPTTAIASPIEASYSDSLVRLAPRTGASCAVIGRLSGHLRLVSYGRS